MFKSILKDHTTGSAWTLLAVLCFICIPLYSAHGDQLLHDTQTDFAGGVFDQTVLDGSENEPQILIDYFTTSTWDFVDDSIAGWTFTENQPGNVAEENPDGQIHLKSMPHPTEESYAFASRTNMPITNQFVVEFYLYFDSLQDSKVVDPFTEIPHGACQRLDIINSDAGFRMDIFTDRMVSFYKEDETYPTVSYVDVTTELETWYKIRLEGDFDDPSLPVQVYRDDIWVGELNGDTLNSASNTIRMLNYSRNDQSGVAESHIDWIKYGLVEIDEFYSDGSYTSQVLELGPVDSFDSLTWTGTTSPYPWNSWEKYENNPVISGTALVENILTDIDDPLQQPIMYDGKYWVIYSANSSLQLAYTTDPNLLNWTKYEGNPILSPDAGENYVYSPQIFMEGSTYYLFYDVSLSIDNKQRLEYATALAPTGPWTKGQIILDLGATGQWDALRVSEPFVWKEGDTYYMYYMGDFQCNGCAEQIGLATTTAALFPLGPEADGTWTRQGLVLPHNPDGSGWDSGLTADPSIIKVDGIYYMRYTGSYANEHWQLGTAWAIDPMGPWFRPDAPDIVLGGEGEWDDDRLVRGAIHYHNGLWYSPYTGAGGPYQGGMATASSAISDLLTIETRTSEDGVEWEEWTEVTAGGQIQSTPNQYLQYRVNFVSSGDFSPVLNSISIEYQLLSNLVSLNPKFQSTSCGGTDTLWLSIDEYLGNIKGGFFTFKYNDSYIDPVDIIKGDLMVPPSSYTLYSLIGSDSIHVDFVSLLSTMSGPGNAFGIVYNGINQHDSIDFMIDSSSLRDPSNHSIFHVSRGAKVQIDCTAPTFSVVSPASGGFYADPPIMEIDFVDNLGLNRAYYQIDACNGVWNPIWEYDSESKDTTVNWPLPEDSSGVHIIYFKILDDGDNPNSDTCTTFWAYSLRGDYVCGDANNDSVVDVSDAVYIINYAFSGGPSPVPYSSGDANCDASVDVSDAVFIINYAFAGGNNPCDSNGDQVPDC
ncbi:MAG: hypothetical protein GF404_10065 [candidate division Zixibacteria bacterium]|nr:hypothetical protein [candidate division Zixibacteria bacterium]